MASRGRRGRMDPRGGFGADVQDTSGNIHPSILKAARKSGQLNISGRALTSGPCVEKYEYINIHILVTLYII